MKTIYKYQAPPSGGSVSLQLPAGAIFLSIQLQRNRPEFWFEVDTSVKAYEDRYFISVGTGWDLEECGVVGNCSYLGTYQEDDTYTWHVYEVLS